MRERLIVRLPNWLGDTVMAVPALRALREGLAGAELTLAGPWAGLLAAEGLADTVRTWPRGWSGRLRCADGLRAFDARTALLLPSSFEAAAAAMYWGARRRVGFATGGRRWLLTDAVPPPRPRLHQVDEYALLAERLGVTVRDRTPRLTPPATGGPERAEARALLDAAGAAGGRPWVGVHLGAAYGTAKLWPEDRVTELCGRVHAAGGVPVLLGTPDEAPLAARVARASGAANVAGRDRPELLPALLAELDGLVCGDTGLAHLAAALGTPVAALFGPTDPALSAPRGPVAIVRHAVPCAPCFYRTCPIEHPCMRGIGAPDVLARLTALLAEAR